ncbi:MAG TPA: protein kinase [Vicinamibacterales bacterium]|nr:protein kinase [Vicinamibacterales bacterium]
MSLNPGSRIGVYDITAPLGEGGMGQVWRATDSTLGRQVAIKILPDAFATDPERLARFEREAKTLASLNHPHIAAIYGFEKSSGMHALVMELVEGEDLSQRIARGAIPMDEALPIAKQIAEALEAAHEQGIIHRDLKPANIKVRPDGTVKVLDFGLAKGVQDPKTSGPQDLLNSPTITMPAMTMRGVILGTAAYMSPEQAAGKPVDKRSDLWSFGVVLLEMLSGRQAFTGESVSHVIASVLKSEPDWSALPADTPPPIRRLLRRCLEKDRKRRLTDAGVARLEIDESLAAPAADIVTPSPPVRPQARLTTVAPWVLLLATLVGVAALWPRGDVAVTPLVSRALIDFPQFAFSGARLGNLFALSPDGTRLVFAGNPDGKNKLYLRPLDQFEATAIPGTEEGSQPFFSPDGNSIGFFAGGKLKKVSLTGGAPVTLAEAPNPAGGSWGADDTIVFAPDQKGLVRTSAAGAPPKRVTERQGASGLHGAPLLLPGGKAVVFTNNESSLVRPAVDVVSLDTGEVKRLIDDGCCAAYATTGHLIYAHSTSGTIFAAPYDPQRPTVIGESARVLDGVMAGGLKWRSVRHFAVWLAHLSDQQ